MSQSIFKRYEKKYVISESTCREIRTALSEYMIEDKYGSYSIYNIYYDTAYYDLIRSSIEKPAYKEKLRLRSYGRPVDGKAFLELKKKFDGVVYKRREQLAIENVNGILQRDKNLINTQILKEIDYFLNIYPVSPKVFISYDREALQGKAQHINDVNSTHKADVWQADTSWMNNEELRVTFDKNIRFREKDLSFEKGNYGRELLEPGKILMEIKIPGAFPIWLSKLLSEYKIFPTTFSKYGKCYEDYLSHDILKKGVAICA